MQRSKRRRPEEGDGSLTDAEEPLLAPPLTAAEVNKLSEDISDNCEMLLSWLPNGKDTDRKDRLRAVISVFNVHTHESPTRIPFCSG